MPGLHTDQLRLKCRETRLQRHHSVLEWLSLACPTSSLAFGASSATFELTSIASGVRRVAPGQCKPRNRLFWKLEITSLHTPLKSRKVRVKRGASRLTHRKSALSCRTRRLEGRMFVSEVRRVATGAPKQASNQSRSAHEVEPVASKATRRLFICSGNEGQADAWGAWGEELWIAWH